MCRRDQFWALAIALGAAVVGGTLIASANTIHFYQFFMPEAVYIACTGDAGHPGALFGPLLEFLAGRSASFDCANLPPDKASGAVGIFAQTHLYLMLAAAWAWRALSPSYANLWPLGSFLYGAYAAGVFSLLRLFFSRKAAVAGAIFLAGSPFALSMLTTLRDFSKAPFTIWALVLLIGATRLGERRQQVTLAALSGVISGVGYGFRTDLAIMVPTALILIFIGMGPRNYLSRALAVAGFLGCFAVSGWPVISIGNTSALGAMTMEGSADPFTRYLDLAVPQYSWGARYSDELTLSSIAADMRTELPNWDANEGEPAFGTSQAITRSTGYFTARLDLTIGDLATRSLKAAGWILAFPSAFNTDRIVLDPAGVAVSPSILTLPYVILGKLWVIPLGVFCFAVFMLRECALRPRQTISLALAFGVLLGYTALQFSLRHAFHLEFFWVAGAMSLFFAVREARSLAPAVPRFLVVAGAATTVVAVVYASLLALQDYAMKRTVADLLSGHREPIAVTKIVENEVATLTIPVPDAYSALVFGRPDSMVGEQLPISQQWETIAAVDRLLVSIGGPDCPTESLPVSINYSKRDVWQPFDEVRTLQVTAENQPISLLLPAFYRATQNFDSLSVPARNAACILSVERLLAPTRLPAVMTMTLPQDWQQHGLHLNLF